MNALAGCLKRHRLLAGVPRFETGPSKQGGTTRVARYRTPPGEYLPTTLKGRALGCAVEDLFSLEEDALTSIEAELLSDASRGGERMKLWTVGSKRWALPMASLGEPVFGLAPADAIAPGRSRNEKARRRIEVRTLRESARLDSEIAIAGCDPALLVIADRVLRESELLSRWLDLRRWSACGG